MSIELTQKLVAITLIIGGLGGGYFALTGGSSWTLLGMHKALGREENTDWESVANKYKDKDQTDVIDGIKKESKKLAKDIEKWCNSNKNTYFLGETDKTYQSYAIWCLKDAIIKDVLEKKGFKWLTDKWDKKLEKYKQSFDRFIVDESQPAKPNQQQEPIANDKLNNSHIINWCNGNRSKRYKYQSEETERRVRLFCYWNDEQIAEANKPPVAEQSGPSVPASDPTG